MANDLTARPRRCRPYRDASRRATAAIVFWLILMVLAVLGGCARYSVPGAAADFHALGITAQLADDLSDPSIRELMERKPLASFPANVAVVRVQAADYCSHSVRSPYRGERASVITTREVESEESFQRLQNLPMLDGIATLNRMVLPARLNSEEDLRQAAAAVHADMLLIYTFDTVFDVESQIPPLGVITLGLFPEDQARVTSTASAALLDTRNGYVYALAEATSKDQQLTNAWTKATTVDQVRRRTEAEAFELLVGELEEVWADVVRRYAGDGDRG